MSGLSVASVEFSVWRCRFDRGRQGVRIAIAHSVPFLALLLTLADQVGQVGETHQWADLPVQSKTRRLGAGDR